MNTRLQTRTLRTESGWTVEASVVDATSGEVLGRAISLVPARVEEEQEPGDSIDALEAAECETAALAVRRASVRGREGRADRGEDPASTDVLDGSRDVRMCSRR